MFSQRKKNSPKKYSDYPEFQGAELYILEQWLGEHTCNFDFIFTNFTLLLHVKAMLMGNMFRE